MAEIRLTAAQQSAVESRGGTLLVSAAAGSGKTKVLVERLMSMVCNPDDPANMDDFLLITYTKAAAAELRSKISSALTARLAKETENRHLQRQLTRIYMTQISTVHAFCAATLRSYACTLEIPSDFKVAENQEAALMQERVLDALLDERYEQIQEDAAFRAFADGFGYGRDDRRMNDLLLELYEQYRCRVDSEAWLRRCDRSYCELPADAGETIWGEYLIHQLRRKVLVCREKLAATLSEAEQDEVLAVKYVPVLLDNLSQMDDLLSAKSWDGVFAARVDSFGRLPPVPKCQASELKERIQAKRKAVLEDLKSAQKPFYAESTVIMGELSSVSEAVSGLAALLREFDRRYSEEKRRRKLLDFSDLEHEMLRLLGVGRGGSAAAKEISARYREILVDEYQDSNAVQEAIFQAVSRDGRNLFLVGDVKQSIYRFRLAEPEIFQQKYESFSPCGTQEAGQPSKILLSENFRSRKEILDAVNDVFKLCMNRTSTELSYGEEEALRVGLSYLPTPQKKVELHCIDLDIVTGEDEADAQRTQEEAEFAAERIEQLLREKTPIQDGDSLRSVRPGDVVILMRSPGIAAAIYQKALQKRGIACVTDRSGSILDTTEGECFLSLLAVLDNPHRDIPLASLLLSPVFGFSPEELAQPRSENRRDDLYDCLCACPDKSRKLSGFLNWLSAARARVRELPLTELLDEVDAAIHFTESFAALPGGRVRTANVAALRSLAAQFESDGSHSLMRFYDFLQKTQERGDLVQAPGTKQAQDAVTIMTIHKSKGLEFPVVVLADLCHQMNLTDNARSVLTDSELLIGTDVTDTASRSVWSGIAKMAIQDKHRQQTVAEELRVLYVAMTRAREMLIMTCCSGRLRSTLERLSSQLSEPLSPEVTGNAKSLGDWVLAAALLRDEAAPLFALCGGNDLHRAWEDSWDIRLYSAEELRSRRVQSDGQTPEKTEPALSQEAAKEALWEGYSHPEAARTPSKLTATQLKGRLRDLEAAEQTAPAPTFHKNFARPDFLHDRPLTGAEKGNATHLFMQFARYEACSDRAGVEAELNRLRQGRFLSKRQAEAVDCEKILRLFTSDFGKRILSAKELHREFKFSILTDAGEYDPAAAGEQVMLQGVVDCFWEEAEGLVIVDFKTDRISGNLDEKRENYRPQITAYAKALTRIFEKPIKACCLYFFDADAVETI